VFLGHPVESACQWHLNLRTFVIQHVVKQGVVGQVYRLLSLVILLLVSGRRGESPAEHS
jgi:hypothetical protein